MKCSKGIASSLVATLLSAAILLSACGNSESDDPVKKDETVTAETQKEYSSSSETTSNTFSSTTQTTESEFNESVEGLEVHVLCSEKGDNGDSTILRYGDTEILIDTAEGDITYDSVKELIEDGGDHTWEYLIFTHPDRDHIGKVPKLLQLFEDHDWKVKSIIDFGSVDSDSQESGDEKDILKNYKSAINNLEDVIHYSPNDSLSEESLTKEYVIDNDFKFTLLYHDTFNSDNDKSVCSLFQIGNQKLLFTGDLGKDGERSLLKYHRELLKNVTFFKAGHHGSNSSNIAEFVDWIRPAYVAITYNKGASGVVESIERFLRYTDYIYPSFVNESDEGAKNSLCLYGKSVFRFDGNRVGVETQYSQGCTIKQVDSMGSSWYWDQVNNNRITDEINTYILDENIQVMNDGGEVEKNKNGNYGYYNCTLVKYGHYDVLIDCGNLDDSKTMIEKLKDYVVDGVIECMVVSHYHPSSYNLIAGSSLDDQCVLNDFKVMKVIDNSDKMTNCKAGNGTVLSTYLSNVLPVPERVSLSNDDNYNTVLCDNFSIGVYRGYNAAHVDNEDDYSLVTIVDYFNSQMVFVGDLTDYSWFNDNHSDLLKNVKMLRFSSSYTEYSKMNGLNEFLKKAKPDVVMLGSPINHWNNGKYFIKRDSIDNLESFLVNSSRNSSIKVYSCGYVGKDNKVMTVSGDLDFTIVKNNLDGSDTVTWFASCSKSLGSGKKSKLKNSYYGYEPDDIARFPDDG